MQTGTLSSACADTASTDTGQLAPRTLQQHMDRCKLHCGFTSNRKLVIIRLWFFVNERHRKGILLGLSFAFPWLLWRARIFPMFMKLLRVLFCKLPDFFLLPICVFGYLPFPYWKGQISKLLSYTCFFLKCTQNDQTRQGKTQKCLSEEPMFTAPSTNL